MTSSFWTLRVKLTSRRPHTAMYNDGPARRACVSVCWPPLPLGEGWGEGAQLCKAHVFNETFSVNSAFNAEVFVATPHAVAMEFDLFGERRSSHGGPRSDQYGRTTSSFRNHLKVACVLGKESQSILKGRGRNQRVRNHQPVTKGEPLN